MTVKVEVPSVFARYAGNQSNFDAEGQTVGETIQDIGKKHPELQKLVLNKDGELLNYIAIFINGEDIRPKTAARPVKDGDTVKVVMLIEGG